MEIYLSCLRFSEIFELWFNYIHLDNLGTLCLQTFLLPSSLSLEFKCHKSQRSDHLILTHSSLFSLYFSMVNLYFSVITSLAVLSVSSLLISPLKGFVMCYWVFFPLAFLFDFLRVSISDEITHLFMNVVHVSHFSL